MVVSMEKSALKFRVPGKIVLNGGYLVCTGEKCISVNVGVYANIEARTCTEGLGHTTVELTGKDSVVLGLCGKNIVVERAADAATGKFVRDIVAAFWDVAGGSAQLGVDISIWFDDGFWTHDGVKTGIGSSACIVVALVHSFQVFYAIEQDTSSLCLEVNRKIAPRASGVDVLTCSYGNVVYSTKGYARIYVDRMLVLVLGSRGGSSDTRSMLTLLDSKRDAWECLSGINSRIVDMVCSKNAVGCKDCVLRPLYREYLSELGRVSSLIVPDCQFSVLLKTFSVEEVVACGVSGSGGEDCVWCLVCTESAGKVVDLWSRSFSYVRVHKTLSPGGKENLQQ